ncbi:MAG TPA: two-component system response regulator KdpE [Burkholderiales bacterium]|nr:two-component system response regulator KdpE [Burkholderiales bacterium]
MNSIILIEDEKQIRRFVRTSLEAEGYQVFEAETGKQGVIETATRKPDLVILDLGLPDMDGIEVIGKIREWSSLPVIILSARSEESEKIDALDAGADDYLTKPFGSGELLARIRVALRRQMLSPQGQGSVFEIDGLSIDLAGHRVILNETEIHLTPIEYRLLSILAKHAGRVLTHRFLLKEVWGPSHVDDAHYLRIYMGQLRHKLEKEPANPRYLLTETGVGYRLAAE